MNNYVVIMAGGVGSRFWPASREALPKQFIDILGVGKSLIRLTFERFIRIVPSDHIYVITNEKYRSLVKSEIPELSDFQIIGEPSRNNTAPCVAYSAFKINAIDSESCLLVAPSDHFIGDEAEFISTVNHGFSFVKNRKAILTLGMYPTRPDTGYGYIELGDSLETEKNIFLVKRFTEKPDLDTARDFLQKGNFCWNSGMFFFGASAIIDDFKNYAPDIYKLLHAGPGVYNTEFEKEFIERNYPKTPNISIDYAIMENAGHLFSLRADFGWSDLGTWGSLYDFCRKDEHDNVEMNTDLLNVGSSGNLIRSRSSKKIILKDIRDFMIIDEGDILVIWPRKDEEELRNIRKKYED